MPLTYEQTMAPTEEPVTLDELKEALHIIGSDEDNYLRASLIAARDEIESALHRQFMTATYVLYLDWFPPIIRLPKSPVQSVESIKYLNAQGTLETLDPAEYQTDLISEPARITESENGQWPTLQSATFNTVRVEFIAGYPSRAAVPDVMKLAIKMRSGDFFEHREAQLDRPREIAEIMQNPTYQRLLIRYKV